MRKSYLAEVVFDDEALDSNGRKLNPRWPDGNALRLSVLDGPLNENNRLVEELLWRGVGNKYGIRVKVIKEVST